LPHRLGLQRRRRIHPASLLAKAVFRMAIDNGSGGIFLKLNSTSSAGSSSSSSSGG